ncbi:MAG: hypothetical protein LC687_05040 [Actinobacteria bacterium]|nr:hypothetical protein [Actinomycetota bacterium]MCA1807200.1 hypothetical protein [Actinomycetota bacterium]
MDPYLIGNIMLGVLLFITTWTAKMSTEQRAQRKENRRLRLREELFEDHVYELRRAMAHHGVPRPPAPPGLFDDPYPEEDELPK